tara:strand:- start:148 stop:948 length:801 start_codon:yes stop_codon:yes gene_type:complete
VKKLAFIHIGLHKTGSTSLQRFLKLNEIKQKIYIPKSFRLDNDEIINHAPLAWYFYGDERFKKYNEVINNFKKEIENKKKIFISSEDFSILLSNIEQKKNFERIFEKFKIIYICFLRNTKNKNLSLTNELIKHRKVRYRIFKKVFKTIIFFKLNFFGEIRYNFYNSPGFNFMYTDIKKIVRKFKKKSRGFFLFFEYNENTRIENIICNFNFFHSPKKEKILLNVTKYKIIDHMFNMLSVNRVMNIKKTRNIRNINFINKCTKKTLN